MPFRHLSWHAFVWLSALDFCHQFLMATFLFQAFFRVLNLTYIYECRTYKPRVAASQQGASVKISWNSLAAIKFHDSKALLSLFFFFSRSVTFSCPTVYSETTLFFPPTLSQVWNLCFLWEKKVFHEEFHYHHSVSLYQAEIALARTFTFESEVQALKEQDTKPLS